MQRFINLKKRILSDKETKEIYDKLAPEYSLVSQIIEARLNKGVSQADLAKKIGTKQSAISRFESGGYNPSLAFLIKISKALDRRVIISLKEKAHKSA